MELSIIDDDQYNNLVNKTIEEIKANPKSVEKIKQKAIKTNKTLEQAIIDDAKWIVNQKLKKVNAKTK